MKLKFTFLLVLFTLTLSYGQLVLTEIMYNPPESGTDSLEYLEFYNAGTEAINLEGYQVTEGVTYAFPSTMLDAGAYYTIGVDTLKLFAALGIALTDEWESGGLSNGGESIVVVDNNGAEVINITYDDNAPWPSEGDGTDGEGASIELCDPSADASDGNNWRVSSGNTGVVINEREVLATIGSNNTATCEVAGDEVIVELVGIEFIPRDITIDVGQTVKWVNTGGRHNINGSLETFPDNPEGFRNGDPSSELFTFEFTFTIPGVYNYQCDPHSDVGMMGSITVLEEEKPDLVITEILYNDPGMTDSLEFIEIYNRGGEAANLGGLILKDAISHVFEEGSLAAGGYLIVSQDSAALNRILGVASTQWTDGRLDNRGESIILTTAGGDTIDIVEYEDLAPWPGGDGNGASIVLCDALLENPGPADWGEATTSTGVTYEGAEILANPGGGSFCGSTITEAKALNENGEAINQDMKLTLEGTVHTPNFRPGGLTIVIMDDTGDGITVFSASDNFDYTVTEGDKIQVFGAINQFNGLTQIVATDVVLVSSGEQLMEPTVVTALSESTESRLVKLENLTLVNPDEWGGGTSGFNVDMTDGTDTFDIRIDADIDLFSLGYPTGTFSVTGVGAQFDSSSPFDEGYQLLPRSMADIDPYVPFVEMFPARNIADVTTVDEMGVTDSLGINCAITGVVYGPNYRPSGLQFTIIDAEGHGIGLFNNSGDLGYAVAEGDLIEVKGSINQFRGLTQIAPSEITLLTSGNTLVEARTSTALGEDTESELVVFPNVTYVDESEWSGDGSSFNVNLMTEGGQTITMRIDNDNELSTMAAPSAPFNVTGLGGQFDTEDPLLDGYQLLPRYAADIDESSNTEDILTDLEVNIFPNPVTDILTVSTEYRVLDIKVLTLDGRLILSQVDKEVALSQLEAGMYLVRVVTEQGAIIKPIMKQ